MQVSSSHMIPRSNPRPSEEKMLSPRTDRSNKARQETPTTSIKLPLLQDVTNQPMLSTGTTDTSMSEQKSARMNISRLSQNEAFSLLQQYNKIVGGESRSARAELPHIKMNMRPEGHRPIPARDRFTTTSLDRVEKTGKKLFTEGLSSRSKFKEPPLAMHRKDIIGANMPETVRLARERSNIVFGLNRYRPRKQRQGGTGPRNKSVKTINIEPASVTANQIMAPLGVPQKVDLGDVWPDNTQKSGSKITRMLRTMEEKYGKDTIVQTLPPSPNVLSDDFLSLSTVTTPVMTPRRTPITTEKVMKPNLSVVSLGESLADLPEKARPIVRIPSHARDKYNQLERYRQHVDDKKHSRYEMRYNTVRERKSVLYPFLGEMSPQVGHRNKTKAGARKKREIVVSLTDMTGTQEQDDSEAVESVEEEKVSKQDGTFHVEGVKGVGTGQRLWSPSSVSTAASVANPPPSVEAGLYDLEFPNIKDPAAMFTVDEEKTVDNAPHLAVEADGHMSDSNASHVSSTHLSVPSPRTGKESRPQTEVAYGERPPRKDDPMADVDFAPVDVTYTAASPQKGSRVSSEMKVTTLELFPGSSQSARPTISISGSDEVEADLMKHKQEEDEAVEETQKDDGLPRDSGSGFQEAVRSDTSQTNIHSQSITFISPLHTQSNAKRQ